MSVERIERIVIGCFIAGALLGIGKRLDRVADQLEQANAHATLVEIELQRIANANDRLVSQLRGVTVGHFDLPNGRQGTTFGISEIPAQGVKGEEATVQPDRK